MPKIKESLVSQTANKPEVTIMTNDIANPQTTVPGDQLATILPRGMETVKPFVEPVWANAPVMMFYHPLSPTFAPRIKHAIPSVQTGDPVLVLPLPAAPLALHPLKFMLINANQFFCATDGQGVPTKTAKEKTEEYNKEYIDVLMVAFTSVNAIPCTAQFRTTKCGCVHEARNALELASTEEWAKQSADYAATLVMPHPWARFTCSVGMQSTTSKSSGFLMQLAKGNITPATVADWMLLKDCFTEGSQGKEWYEAASKVFHDRCAEVERLMVK